jgi:hypothetical protein
MTEEDAIALDAEMRLLRTSIARSRLSVIYTAQMCPPPPPTPAPAAEDSAAGRAQAEWTARFGEQTSVGSVAVLQVLVPETADVSGDRLTQLRLNCLRMLGHRWDAEEMLTGEISRAEFHRAFVEYNGAAGLREILEMFTPPTDQARAQPCFYPGICIGARETVVSNAFQQANQNSWALVSGHEIGELILQRRLHDGGVESVPCHLCPPGSDTRFGIVHEGTTVYVQSIQSLLEHLGLAASEGLRLPDSEEIMHSELSGEDDQMTFQESNSEILQPIDEWYGLS